jgi:hypothetical protein
MAITNTNLNPAARHKIGFKKKPLVKTEWKVKGDRTDESNIKLYESPGLSETNSGEHVGIYATGLYERFSTFGIKAG